MTVLVQWDEWLSAFTDRLLDLEQRAATTGSAALRLDLAAAFVCRKSISSRVEALRAGGSADGPLVDDHGEVVADDLSGAATLLTAILDRVEATLSADEAGQAAAARNRVSADADAVVAEGLAADLGDHVRRVAELRTRLEDSRDRPDALADVAADLAEVRAELEAGAAERTALLSRWASVADDVGRANEREDEVRAVVQTCRDKVHPVPNVAVPSVSALGQPEPIDALSARPWPAVRAVIVPYLDRLERVQRALEEVAARHLAVLTRRDELRGLLQAFRDKAGAHGMAEHPSLEPVYEAAETVLWSAPCDVDAAAVLVSDYTAAVNRAVAASPPPRPEASRDGDHR